jgi:hypothetical protein
MDVEQSILAPQSADTAPANPSVTTVAPVAKETSGVQGWTLILIAVGIGAIACCLLIPQADENRKLRWEVEKLKGDMDHFEKQVAVNDEFLRRVNQDPAVMERLAQRQMRLVKKGTSVLDIGEATQSGSQSAFGLLGVAAAPPMPEIRYPGGKFENLCRDPKSRLYLLGGGFMLVAMGLVLGTEGKPRTE